MTQTAVNYADALYELARDEGLDREILEQLLAVRRLMQENPDYVRLLSAPNLSKGERLCALDEAFAGRVHTYLLSFLKLLCERGHIRTLADCVERYNARFNEEHGILMAKVTTAVPLSDGQTIQIRKRLSELTGKQVNVMHQVDPSVLGGIRLEYEGRELDGTLRQRLDGIQKTLSDTVL